MRATQTGTGKGNVLGVATIYYYASDDATIESCGVEWDGDDSLAPVLPGLAFDRYLPNVRSISEGDRTLFAQEAQDRQLAAFEKWLDRAAGHVDGWHSLPLFASAPPLIEGKATSSAAARTELPVRINSRKKRLWVEADHHPKSAGDVLFSIDHEVLWNWVATTALNAIGAAPLLRSMRKQCEYYRAVGIPSDFRLRQVGRACFAAWPGTPGIPLG